MKWRSCSFGSAPAGHRWGDVGVGHLKALDLDLGGGGIGQHASSPVLPGQGLGQLSGLQPTLRTHDTRSTIQERLGWSSLVVRGGASSAQPSHVNRDVCLAPGGNMGHRHDTDPACYTARASP